MDKEDSELMSLFCILGIMICLASIAKIVILVYMGFTSGKFVITKDLAYYPGTLGYYMSVVALIGSFALTVFLIILCLKTLNNKE